MTNHSRSPVAVAVSDGDTDAALRFGGREAVIYACGVRLIHADPTLATGPEEAVINDPATQASGQGALARALERARDLIPDQVHLTSMLVGGSVVQGVVHASRDARAVVLQRRDAAELMRTVTRSTSREVAARAHTPVACVPAHWPLTEGHPQPITVGLDVPRRSQAMLRAALAIAHKHGRALRIAHAWIRPDGYDDMVTGWAARESDARTRSEIETVLADVSAHYLDVPVEVTVSHGTPQSVLLDCARRSELIIVGHHDARIPAGSGLGPVASAVLRESPCPVLLLPPSSLADSARAGPASGGWSGAQVR